MIRTYARLSPLFVSAILSAATNSLTVTEKSGVTTVNYPVQLGRPFVQGEISTCPRAIIAGTPASAWQADVKNRWPDGSVKYAILSFLIPSLSANSTVTITFDSQTCANIPLTKAAMQTDANYDFDAQMLLTNGSTLTADARTMLDAGDYTLWTSGQVAQTILLGRHDNSATCNSHACSIYDIGFDTNKSFRPLFYATFWPTINKVRVRFVGEIAQTEALQDQTYSLVLTTGKASPASVYTKSSFTHTALSRWTKLYWIGGAPSTIAINQNLSYLTTTLAVPNYDTSLSVPGGTVTTDCAAWTAASKDIYQAGQWTIYQPTAGGRPDIGPYPDWNIKWMYTGDSCIRDQALGNADLSAAWPIHVREGKAGKNMLRSDTPNAGTGVGHVLSISNRPSIYPGDWCTGGSGFTASADRLNCVGTITNGGWTYDPAHVPLPTTVPYLLTGDFWYLEEAWFQASRDAASNYASIYERGPTGAEGVFSHPQLRATAWMLRDRVETLNLTPDSTAEASYLSTLMTDGIAAEEGIRNITGTALQSNAAWTWGHTQIAVSGRPWWSTSGAVTTPPPLHTWWRGETAFAQSDYGIETSVVQDAMSAFEAHYMIYSLGRAKELGHPTSALLTWASVVDINILTNATLNPHLISNGRWPTTRLSDGAYLPTWAAFLTGYHSAWQTATNFDPESSGGLTGPDGYTSYAMGAVSFATGETDGPAAWNWVNTNIYAAGAGPTATNPKWAMLPRSLASPVAPTITTTSPLTSGTVGTAYSLQFTATGDTPITWTYDSVPGGLTFTSGGLLSGTSNTAGTSTINVTATNAAGSAGPTGFSLTRGAAGVYGRVTGRMTGTIR
jgi:hypothetical protein